MLYADPLIAELLGSFRAAEFEPPIVGLEVGPQTNWLVECAWPLRRTAIVIDEEPDRDEWFAQENWTVIDAQGGYDLDAVGAEAAAAMEGEQLE